MAWVARTCNYAPMPVQRLRAEPCVGVANMLAVNGMGGGMAMEIECTIKKSRKPGLVLGGIVEEEEIDLRGKKLRRKSTARGSVENVLCAVGDITGVDFGEYEVALQHPGRPAYGRAIGRHCPSPLRCTAP